METKTHWRKLLKTKYLVGDEIGKEITVEIESFETEKVFDKKEQHEVDKLVIYFKGGKKGMIVTPRKAKDISRVTGTSFVEDWVGKKITIYPKNEKHFGEIIPVLTVKQDFSQTKV